MFHLGRFFEFAAAASAATMVRTGFALFVKDRGAGSGLIININWDASVAL